jgi:hypothetical protein
MLSSVPARFLLDVAARHVAVLVLGNLSGDENKVAGAHARVKREIRVALTYRDDLIVHCGLAVLLN